jgi:hypothetical protein
LRLPRSSNSNTLTTLSRMRRHGRLLSKLHYATAYLENCNADPLSPSRGSACGADALRPLTTRYTWLRRLGRQRGPPVCNQSCRSAKPSQTDRAHGDRAAGLRFQRRAGAGKSERLWIRTWAPVVTAPRRFAAPLLALALAPPAAGAVPLGSL